MSSQLAIILTFTSHKQQICTGIICRLQLQILENNFLNASQEISISVAAYTYCVFSKNAS